ncbi:MAG: hypothetical protein J0H78_19015 [Rhizobiales bacterium]|nr:hypothetical protein [Hyphomicrobiales bacterium]
MSDSLPPIAPAPPGLSAETLASADAIYARHGYSEQERAAAGYRAAPAAGTDAPAPKPGDTMGFTPPANTGGGKTTSGETVRPPTAASHLPYEQRRDALIALKGKVDDATIAAAAKAEGVDLADLKITAPTPPENVTLNEANERLRVQGDPALTAGNSPDDYSFQFDPKEIAALDETEVAEANLMFKDALHAAQIPLSQAQSIVRETVATINHLDGLSDAARELEMKAQGEILKRSGNINEIMHYAELTLSRFPEDFRNEMFANHAWSSADAYLALAAAGRMIEAREARYGTKK